MITCPFLFERVKQGELIKETLRSPCYFVIQVWPIVPQPLTLGQVTLYFLKEDLAVHHFLKKGNVIKTGLFLERSSSILWMLCVSFLVENRWESFRLFLEWTMNPDLKPWKKPWRTWTGTTFYLLQRQAIWSVLVKMWGFSSEPKLWFSNHQFLKGYIPEN